MTSLLTSRPSPLAPSRHALARLLWDLPEGSRLSPRLGMRDDLPAEPAAGFAVEDLDAVEAGAHRAAWMALTQRALEPNVFLDPDFVLPAALHLGGARRPRFLMVWATAEDGVRTLAAVCPVVAPAYPLSSLATAWFHDLATLGFPLLDRRHGGAALRTLLLWLGEGLPRACGIVIRALPVDGPTAALLRAAVADLGLPLAVLAEWQRAALRRGGAPAGVAALSTKSAKELRRQRRRLGDLGVLTRIDARGGEALRDGIEQFLALEAAGWKGTAGTALLCDPGRTAFARTAARLLGRRGLCRVEGLAIDGAPVALALILTAGATDFLWKIAYREDVARLSPGVQLVLDLTEAQLRGGAPVMDSCAVQGHPMIDRLWRDRLRLADIAVATRTGGHGRFRAALAAESAVRWLRVRAKHVVRLWRERRDAGAVSRG